MIYVTCTNCSIMFTVTDEFHSARKKDHLSFYCPNGHSNYYAQKNKWELKIDELEAELRRTRRDMDFDRLARLELLDEFARCPVRHCATRQRGYHYSTMQGLLRHLAEKHGITIAEQKELSA